MKRCLISTLVVLTAGLQVPVTAELQNVSLGRASGPPEPPSLEFVAQPVVDVDLDFLERYALSDDRAAVLSELVPGTEVYYYFTSLYHQEQGDFARVDALLKTWVERHGESAAVTAIRHRQALMRYETEPQATVDYLTDHFGLRFNHERQIPGEAPDLPTALDPELISREALLKTALQRLQNSSITNVFTPRAYPWLLRVDLPAEHRRVLLEQLDIPDAPGLVEAINADLSAPHSRAFGAMTIHRALTREQLDALLQRRPRLLESDAFVETYVGKLKPGQDNPHWAEDPAIMEAYLMRLESFVSRLAPAHNSLKAHVQYHRLAFDQHQGVYDRDRFLHYLQLPRQVDYANPKYLEQVENRRYAADLNQDFRQSTGLDRIGSDSALVEDYFRFFIRAGEQLEGYAEYVSASYLRRLYAETKLLQGDGDPEQWYSWLDPATVDGLKARVDVAFAPENKRRFDRDEAVTLDLWVKNVDRLLVKVFEIDTRSFYQEFDRAINTDIDLDGLVANQEEVFTYSDPPIRRIRREFSFPELIGRGVWIIEFVGGGTSSRALVVKGGLQYLERTGPAGQLFTIFDEAGQPVPEAEIWFGDKRYGPNESGEIAIPFSSNPGTRHLLLCHGDFATREAIAHKTEQYRMAAGFHIDRESLRTGREAQLAVRPLLYLNEAPMPLSLLEQPVLRIHSRTHDGIESSQEFRDVVLDNGALLVQSFRVPENLAQLNFEFAGTVNRLTDGEPVPLSAGDDISVNQIHQSNHTASLFLTRDNTGYAIEVRDLSGNPLGERAVYIALKPRDFIHAVNVSLKTDAGGRVTLGALENVESLVARADGLPEGNWTLDQPAYTYPDTIHGGVDTPLEIPLPGARPSAVGDVASLLEVRSGTYVADYTGKLAYREGYLVLSGLPAGDYMLHLPEQARRIAVRLTGGQHFGQYIASSSRLLDGRAPTPLQIQQIEADGEQVAIQVAGANDLTRVHVLATRFKPEQTLFQRLSVGDVTRVPVRSMTPSSARYANSREVGDEYRYVVERRFANTYPGNMLDRPSLLLNPWAVKETEAEQAPASASEPPPPAPAPLPAAERIMEMDDGAHPAEKAVDMSPNFDFLDDGTAALYNLVPNDDGAITIPVDALHGRPYIQIIAVDPTAVVSRNAAMPAREWTPADLRLARGLEPESHLVEKQQITVLNEGDVLDVSLVGDAGVQVYDDVADVLALYTTMTGDENLREFAFVGRWPTLSDDEKRQKFSKYASHELNLFLYHKDRAFFDSVVREYLANKHHKTFIDLWLLEGDLSGLLTPWHIDQLNLVEKILLAKRVAASGDAVNAFVRDAVGMLPPDPAGEHRLFLAALHGKALGGGAGGADGLRIRSNFYDYDENFAANRMGGFGGGGGGFGGGAMGNQPMPEPIELGIALKRVDQLGSEGGAAGRREKEERPALQDLYADTDAIREARGRYRALYRETEVTEALVETDYFECKIEAAHTGMVPVNRFWADYVSTDGEKPFLSPHLAEANSSFTEAMLALAVLDLPFEAPSHEGRHVENAYQLTAGGSGIAFYTGIQPVVVEADSSPLMVSQNFYREDDRYRYENNQRYDKFVTEEFLTGVVYGCQIAVTNPTSTPHQIEVLRQVPQGALPVRSGRYTKSERMAMAPYSTVRVEYHFYFPEAGDFGHYPAHVSQDGVLLAAAPPMTIKAVDEPSQMDTTSWEFASQQGDLAGVLEFLSTSNIHRVDLSKILWRLGDRAAFDALTELLRTRLVFEPAVWAYAIHHNDTAQMATYLRYRKDFLAQSGPVLDLNWFSVDARTRKFYQHIEYAPLVNPRAHDLDGKWRITNAQFRVQYMALLNTLAHKKAPTADDLLALTYYALLQDRVAEAMGYFDRLNGAEIEEKVQYDYLAAYLAFYRSEPEVGAAIAARYADYPVARWRERFAEVRAQAAEIAGASAADGEANWTNQDALAAAEPRLEMELRDDVVSITYANLESCEISFYPIDLEMLFTRSPFKLAESEIFSGVKPAAQRTVALDPAESRATVPLPGGFAKDHIVAKVEGAGKRRTAIRYASDLVAQLAECYGQVQVLANDGSQPLPGVYVKVFAEMYTGQVQFYRDGYTDLRGRFDYASSSTLAVTDVKRFAILTISDDHGASVLEAHPPLQ